MVHLTSCRTLSSDRLCIQTSKGVNKHSEVRIDFREIVDFFVLDICFKPIFCSNVAQKGKTCSRLLEPQKIAPNAKRCSKVAEHNRDRPKRDSNP